jgi:4-hydroxythreonine-4-phosphate dehydrogenase
MVPINVGEVTQDGGRAAFLALREACEYLKDGRIDGVVTAPINKKNIQQQDFDFPGHTEFFTTTFGVNDSLMFMVSETLKIGVATGHMPLSRVSAALTGDVLESKLRIMLQSLKQDFGISKPRVAVLGLNPHAGEDGLLGNEEADVVRPVLNALREEGHLLFGPFPADGFFGKGDHSRYDAVMAMYHDQGLIPFKTLTFQQGTNFTAGLPIVRTSPDHGTAYSLAGKNEASETSMRAALFTALDIIKNRNENL